MQSDVCRSGFDIRSFRLRRGGSSSTTPDTSAPTLLSTSPTHSALKTAVLPVKAFFSESMDSGSLTTTSFVVTRGGVTVTGTVSTDAAVATFTPTSARLDYATLYTAMITTVAKDLSGNALVSAHTWTFTTKTNLDIKAGGLYNVALQDDGTVWSWGENTTWGMGRDIGLVMSDPIPALVSIPTSTVIKMIVTGEGHTLAVDADNKIYSWGQNFYGELGNGTATASLTPVLVSMPTLSTGVTISAVAAGSYHSLALASDGTVYAWGHNVTGELGDGTRTDRTTPVKVSGLTNVIAIAAGYDQGSMGFSLALKSDGTVWGWGCNWDYELAHDTDTGCGAECFDDTATPVQLPGLTNITSIAAGYAFGAAVNNSGNVLAWGWNNLGVFGNGTCGAASTYIPAHVLVSAASSTTLFSGATSVVTGRIGSASEAYVLALKNDGTVWGWGNNNFGVLGDGTTGSTVNCAGNPAMPYLRLYPVQALGLTNIVALSTGEAHSLALKSDGTVWAWGSDANSILGLDESVMADPVLTPTKVPNF